MPGSTFKFPRGRAPEIDPTSGSVTYLRWTLSPSADIFVTSSYNDAGMRSEHVQTFSTTMALDFRVDPIIVVNATADFSLNNILHSNDGNWCDFFVVNASGATRTMSFSGGYTVASMTAPHSFDATIPNNRMAHFSFMWLRNTSVPIVKNIGNSTPSGGY